MTEQGKKWLRLLVPASILTLIIYTAIHNENMTVERGKPTTGKLIEIWHKSYEFEYYVDGQRYTYLDSKPFDGLVRGEQYKMVYDSTDVTAVAIDYHDPVFDTVQFSKTYSKSIRNDFFNKGRVRFKYEAGNNVYERWQYLPNRQKVNENKKYVIWYNKAIPQIAYLSL